MSMVRDDGGGSIKRHFKAESWILNAIAYYEFIGQIGGGVYVRKKEA